jgi:hypothetical protein
VSSLLPICTLAIPELIQKWVGVGGAEDGPAPQAATALAPTRIQRFTVPAKARPKRLPLELRIASYIAHLTSQSSLPGTTPNLPWYLLNSTRFNCQAPPSSTGPDRQLASPTAARFRQQQLPNQVPTLHSCDHRITPRNQLPSRADRGRETGPRNIHLLTSLRPPPERPHRPAAQRQSRASNLHATITRFVSSLPFWAAARSRSSRSLHRVVKPQPPFAYRKPTTNILLPARRPFRDHQRALPHPSGFRPPLGSSLRHWDPPKPPLVLRHRLARPRLPSRTLKTANTQTRDAIRARSTCM